MIKTKYPILYDSRVSQGIWYLIDLDRYNFKIKNEGGKMMQPPVYLWRNIEINAVKKLLRNIKVKDPIYDLGCGDKEIAKLVFPKKKIVGVDVIGNPDVQCDISDMPFRDEGANTVFCNSVLEHVDNLPVILKEISRILKLNGLFILTVPLENINSNTHFLMAKMQTKMLQHKNLFSLLHWYELLQKNHFKVLNYRQYLDDVSTHRWSRLLAFNKFNIHCEKKTLDKWIREDKGGTFSSCVAILATKVLNSNR